jgi:quinoprotein glucose dehydrogenase
LSSPLPRHTASADAVDATPAGDWVAYGGTKHALRYSSLDEISTDTVGKLQKVWTFRTGDLPHSSETEGKYSPETTPIKVGDNLYLCSATNVIIALDAGTGREWWRYDPNVPDDAIPYGATCRGVAYYENTQAEPDSLCAARIIEGTLDARLIAVDAETGQPCPDFGTNGNVDLREGMGDLVPSWYGNVAAPTIVRGIVVIGGQVLDGQAEDAPSGVIRGYDAVTGELAWAWDMCKPELTGMPPDGETYTRGTPNMWTSAAGDDALGYVYLPLGNSAVDYYGGNRKDCENEFSSALVAIDVTTGKPVWHFQTVHYDVWDYDLGSQPTLVDFPTDDGSVPAVILSSKQGEIYALDRRNGEPLFPVEERNVPTDSGVEPESLSETQPFSGYHSLAQPVLQEKDMWGMSPVDQLWCRIAFRRASYKGEYTPPTHDRRYVQYPGYNGGSDWGSVAVDPEDGILVANYNDMPNLNRLLTREEADARGLTPIDRPGGKHDNAQAGSPWAIDVNAGWRLGLTGLMCKEPPYGGIRAIDLATGKTLWDVPLGEARANGPFGISSMLPIRIGTPNNGGPLATAGGLIFVAATTDNLIRAIDIETGEVVWKDELPAGGQANPITFEANGRQFVAIFAGGHHFMETPVGDYLIAYALPRE